MRILKPIRWSLPVAALATLAILPACSVNVKDRDADGNKKVDISTPIGGIHVDQNADARDTGLPVYPGAKLKPDTNDGDKKSANVNLSLPGFSLKVVAAEFTTDDAPDKVIAYYNKELPKYGKPIQCHGSWTGGGHVNASSNGKDSDKPVSCSNDGSGDSVELKVGTEGNQHVVAVKPGNPGTRFALVYVRMHTGSGDTI